MTGFLFRLCHFPGKPGNISGFSRVDQFRKRHPRDPLTHWSMEGGCAGTSHHPVPPDATWSGAVGRTRLGEASLLWVRWVSPLHRCLGLGPAGEAQERQTDPAGRRATCAKSQ